MIEKINQKMIVTAIVLTGLAVGGYFFFQNYSLKTNDAAIPVSSKNYSTHQDLGQISMSKGVRQLSYTFKNNSDQPLQLNNLYTSCMCTKVKIIVGGQESAFAGMQGHKSGLMPINPNMELEPGQKAELLVEFDPNAHGPKGVGPMTRSIILETNSPDSPQQQFTFAGVVVK